MQSPLDELLWERSERLQEATARLAAALTAGDVSTVLLAITEEILEASAGVVYLVGADGTLELRASRGLRSAERWRTLPIDAPIPLAAAIASRTPLFFKSYADLIERYPHLAGSQTPASDLQAVAALPLMHASRLLGGFAVSFTKERSFNEHERRWLERIAAQAALAADRGRLYEAEKQAREKAEALAIDNAMLYRSARGAADAQQQLAETLAETVRLNEMFTGVLAHDLRAPLAAVLTSAGMLEIRAKRAADEPSMRAVGRIVGSGERMSRMIDQILDFTRARVGGSIAVDPRPADLKTITRQVIDELEQAHPDCHVDLSIEGSSDGTWDGDRLSQVFSNLIGNAIEHSPSGSPVRVAVDGGNPETVRVTVHNRGVIPGDLLSKLFEPFTAGEQRRGKSRGLGLGLYITRHIVQTHGGTVGVASTKGEGTTFVVTLPRAAKRTAPDAPHEQAPEPLSTAASRDAGPSHAAEDLRETEARFRRLVDSVKDYAIFMLDPEGRVMTWNAGAKRIKGYDAGEIIGQHFSKFYEESEIRSGKCEMELEVAARDGRFEDEGWRLRKDGSRFWANVVITAVRDRDGGLVGFAKVTRDLSERRQLEEERLRSARAEESLRLRDEFLSLVSHELKTPLTVLQMQLDTLFERFAASDPKVSTKLQRAAQSSERLATLIESLLDVSRLATGRFQLEIKEFDLVETVTRIVDGFRPAATRTNTDLVVDGDARVVGSWDPLRVEQLLMNLLSNATKYAAGKPIRISVHAAAGEVILEVRDQGPGIPEEQIGLLFQRFQRASSARHYGGLGLGLFLIREIVTAHGGTVSVANLPEGGALFRVHMPLRTATATQQVARDILSA